MMDAQKSFEEYLHLIKKRSVRKKKIQLELLNHTRANLGLHTDKVWQPRKDQITAVHYLSGLLLPF